jgi:hypothetical protein
MEFERAISKYYSIATTLATPNVQAALRLMKTSVLGETNSRSYWIQYCWYDFQFLFLLNS